MTLISPLNDKKCLTLLHDEVRRYGALPYVQTFAGEFHDVPDLVEYIRQLQHRDDFGDPKDGPRLPCEVSQRARFAPSEPNCFERTLLYLALAEILDSGTDRSSASLILDRDWHTFPVELRNGLPHIVVLDPYAAAPRNAMLATAYNARRLAPTMRKRMAPWFATVAQNACEDEAGDYGKKLYHNVVENLRRALITGQGIPQSADLDWLLSLVARDAPLWGAQGAKAYQAIEHSVQNFRRNLQLGDVGQFLRTVLETANNTAPDALKAALIAEYGPIAAIALDGVDIALAQEEEDATSVETGKTGKAEKTSPKKSGPREDSGSGNGDSADNNKQPGTIADRLRVMTWAIRRSNPQTKGYA